MYSSSSQSTASATAAAGTGTGTRPATGAGARFAPSAIFMSSTQHANRALLILNQPLQSLELLDRLWRSCAYRVCADGGANRLHDLLRAEAQGVDRRQKYLPDAVHGDLDSLRPEVRGFYTGAGVVVSRDPDQYSTDFQKNVQKILSEYDPASGLSSPARRRGSLAEGRGAAQSVLDIVVLSSIAGRLDQGLGTLHELAREQERRPGLRFWLVTESSLSFVLPGGGERNVIDFQATTSTSPSGASGAGASVAQQRPEAAGPVFTQNVGIVPIYGPSQISTSGLEWDVQDWNTRMGGEVSTSNHVVSSTLEIISTERVLFTIERRRQLPPIQR